MVKLAVFTLLAVVASISAAPTIVLRDDLSSSDTTRVDTKFLRDDTGSRVDTTFLKRNDDSGRVDTTFLRRADDSSRVDTTFLKRDGESDRSDTLFLKRDDGVPDATWLKREVQLESLHSARGDDSERTDTAFL
ncbi:hypothetical protein BJ165DRAFT_1427838 [Panaeolus papilionaceus]|nr:hypothetical protein BJ165DRAFT_1427838 [Panaeolus papilionaceus]